MATWTANEVFRTVDEFAPQFGVDPSVAKSILLAENTKDGRISSATRFKGGATNENETMGIGQVIPSTARGLQAAGFLPPDWAHNPDDLKSQVQASLAAMKEMKGRQKNPNDPFELGAMYNGGNAQWNNYQLGKPLVPETSDYLRKMRNGMSDLNLTPQQIESMAMQQQGQQGPGSSSRSMGSSSTRTVNKQYDPGQLLDYENAMNVFQQMLTSGQVDLTTQNAKQEELTAGLVGAIAQAGQDAGAVAMSKATLEAAAAARRAAILTKANLNPAATNNRMEQALDALDSTSIALEGMRPEIDRRMAVGFFDNPLEYLVNQTRLPGMVQEYNNIVHVQQDQLAKFSTAKKIAADTLSLSEGADADNILAAGVAQAALEASAATAKLKQVQQQAGAKSAADMLHSVQLAQAGVHARLQQLQLTASQVAEREGISEKEAQKQIDVQNLDKLNLMVKAAGGNGYDMSTWKQMDAGKRKALLDATSRGTFGKDFVESLAFIDQVGGLDKMAQGGLLAPVLWVNKTRAEADKLVEQARTAHQANPLTHDKLFKEEETRMQALSQVANTWTNQAEVDMVVAGEANPFKIRYDAVLKNPKYANNIWAQKMAEFGPGSPTAVYQDFNEQQFLKRAATEIGASQDPAAAVKKYATDISSFYKEASKDMRELNKPELFGIRGPVRTYAAQLPYFTAGKRTTVDLADPAMMEKVLTQAVARDLAVRASTMLPGTIFGVGP